jgi:glucuronosyltransferase
MASKIGNHFPPSFVSNIFLGLPSEMIFFERMKNFGATVIQDLILKFYYEPHMTKLYRKELGQDIPTISEIMANASLILSNGHFSLSSHKPYLPNIIDVGGIHSQPAKPLPKVLYNTHL